MSILDKFEVWLQYKGYSSVTPSGHPSTTSKYVKGVKKVASEEGMDVQELAECIDDILPQYSANGVKADKGAKSHHTVLDALKQFKNFIDECAVNNNPKS